MTNMKKFLRKIRFLFVSLIIIFMIGGSSWRAEDQADMLRYFTRSYEFDFFGWTINAFIQKTHASSMGLPRYLNETQKRRILQDFFEIQNKKNELRQSLENILANPDRSFDEEELSSLTKNLNRTENQLKDQSLLAESIVEDYVSQAIHSLDLTPVIQPLPPVLYHVTDLPKNIILSPRNIIRQEKSISLQSDLTPLEIIQLEDNVEDASGYSALVVSVGGISSYPAMVIRTSSLPFLLETVAHEWIHHYLFFHPLGFNYSLTPELRTINETAANIAGQEIRQYILQNFFSDLMTPEKPYETIQVDYSFYQNEMPDSFDFNEEMYLTRLKVDQLLAENRIEEAEEFMEERRLFFWENGYQIRKINQAYFAFHGAYADKPFSAAGADPVGEHVRLLRAKSRNLAEFIRTIRQLSSYKSLIELLESF